MKLFPMLIACAILGGSALAQDGETPPPPALDIRPASEITLEDFLWKNRLIVVFADTGIDPRFQEQMELLAENPQDLLERDVIVVVDTDPAAMTDARRKLRPRGFSFVFVDKDGVVKLRKPVPWDVREITRSIDKTDLRKEELRLEREKRALEREAARQVTE